MAISNNSTGLRPGVCTSSTRPTAPYEGQMIYETDTNNSLVYNGSAWVCITPQSNFAVVSGTASYLDFTSTSYVAIGTAGNQGYLAPITIATGTTALVTFGGNLQTQSGTGEINVDVDVTGYTTSVGQCLRWSSANTNDIWMCSMQHKITGLTAGNNTFTLKVKTSSGTARIASHFLTVVGLP
jgi:hypothetical protein